MPSDRPPTLDPLAVARWEHSAPGASPWLHEEVARRMAERLQWIRIAPQAWAHWWPLRGGVAAQSLLEQRYPQARSLLVERPRHLDAAREALGRGWWQRWSGPRRDLAETVPDGSVQMVWSNMALHFSADPGGLMARWHAALAPGGFLMFSCFGPDTLRELRFLYAQQGWPPPGPSFTDMHDWGDMLVHAGFAEPVMDMERITLTWESPRLLLAELAGLGANLHPGRFAGLRGRGWRASLETVLERGLSGPDGRLALTFEVIYGHAIRVLPRVTVSEKTTVSVDAMRELLRSGGRDTAG